MELFLKDKFLLENRGKASRNTISQRVVELWPNAMVTAGVLVVNRSPRVAGNLSETVEFMTLAVGGSIIIIVIIHYFYLFILFFLFFIFLFF